MSETCGIDFWLDDLMPRLPGATEKLVLHETFAALREFCEEGNAWIDVMTNISTKANNRNIYLDPLPDGNKTGYVLQVLFDPVNSDNSRKLHALTSWPFRSATISDDPAAYYMVDSGHILLNPIPKKAHVKAYTITVTLIPCSEKVRLPVEFSSHWRDAIISGVSHRMMSMISKPWTNTAQSIFQGRKFNNHKKRARQIAESRFGRGERQWVYPQNFAGQRQRHYV